MLADGLWSRMPRWKAHRKRRERRQHSGDLAQLDGSFHAWFEEHGPRGYLTNGGRRRGDYVFAPGGAGNDLGSGRSAAIVDREVWGPRALYTGKAPRTQFGGMCERLEIRIIAASSPQAKGRVGRNSGVHQDRLVKKLRRQGIQSYAATNAYLEAEYLPEHNRRFAMAATRPEKLPRWDTPSR
jgi:hypothetical protein